MAQETQKVLENCELSIGDDAGKDTRDYAEIELLKNGTHYSQGFNFAIHYLMEL